jgi:hypothetical protein
VDGPNPVQAEAVLARVVVLTEASIIPAKAELQRPDSDFPQQFPA